MSPRNLSKRARKYRIFYALFRLLLRGFADVVVLKRAENINEQRVLFCFVFFFLRHRDFVDTKKVINKPRACGAGGRSLFSRRVLRRGRFTVFRYKRKFVRATSTNHRQYENITVPNELCSSLRTSRTPDE